VRQKKRGESSGGGTATSISAPLKLGLGCVGGGGVKKGPSVMFVNWVVYSKRNMNISVRAFSLWRNMELGIGENIITSYVFECLTGTGKGKNTISLQKFQHSRKIRDKKKGVTNERAIQ